jgi:hypothetical protein
MPITDLKAFADKWGQRGDADMVIAKESGFTVDEVHDAREFLRLNMNIAWNLKEQMWKAHQYAKEHPSTSQPNAGLPSVFGPTMAQRTIAMEADTEYWANMERTLQRYLGERFWNDLEALIRKVTGK